ncbi:type II toxin-antitoxin system RelE/ParE family toxin [Candidatus Gracilibacteria bacterium]|nr:type II toxin-antitoxin system RelE/ParE family toxin [Candidatus Gracilibacteria bacterium]
MFYKIVIRDVVHIDINELSDYIYRFSFNQEIAKKIYDDLYKAIFSLEFLPYRFEKYIGEYRRIIVQGSYKIFYKIDEEKKKVIITRVIRTEQDLNNV